MKQSQSLQVKQGQSLVMTQQLQQSIKLLQYNSLELLNFITHECEQNPLLVSEDPNSVSVDPHEFSADASTADEQADSDYDNSNASADNDTTAEPAAIDNWDYQPSERFESSAPRDKHGGFLDLQDQQEHNITLKEHLSKQFLVDEKDATQRSIGLFLIDLVDEAGYIKEDLASVADQLGTTPQHVEAALLQLQQCEPAGICARDLAECLALQLKEQNRYDPAIAKLLEHLDLLGAAKFDALRKACNVEDEDLREMIAEIRTLNPKPGADFHHEIIEQAVPDVIVKRQTNKWMVELNSATLPKVLVNREYHAELTEHARGTDKKYITERLYHANWLVKAMDQRAQTIVKVATEIIQQQDNFFKLGIHHLKPLTLKEIAAETGYHESTISRVTTGKYMMTPRGLFELKYFFTSGLNHAAGGDDVSSSTVKHLIKEIIEAEDGQRPISDENIADQLKGKGIEVARRTVAKYREALHIPSSSKRKRLNRASLTA